MHKEDRTTTSQTKPLPTTLQPRERIYIPYVEGRSEAIRRIMGTYNIATSFIPTGTLKVSLTHLEDPLQEQEQSCIVYTISCAGSKRLKR